jgi:hypothetical protein
MQASQKPHPITRPLTTGSRRSKELVRNSSGC